MNFIERRKQVFYLSVGWISLLIITAIQPERFVLFFLREKSNFVYAHLGAYGVLAFLLCLYLRLRRFFLSLPTRDLLCSLAAVALALVCGATTEMLQIFTLDRAPDWYDFECDFVGALGGIAFFLLFCRVPMLRKRLALSLPNSLPKTA